MAAVGDCSHCTKEACWDHFRKCKDAVVIESSCLGTPTLSFFLVELLIFLGEMALTSSWGTLDGAAAVKPALTLVVLSLLCGIAILLILSVLRYHTPFIRRLFRVRLPSYLVS
jgi:hypothetical protein